MTISTLCFRSESLHTDYKRDFYRHKWTLWGGQAMIYCIGNIHWDHNPSQSFIYSNKSLSCPAASVRLNPPDVFHHAEPQRQGPRFNLVQLSLLTIHFHATF